MPGNIRSRKWLGVVSERQRKGESFAHNTVFVTETKRDLHDLIGEVAHSDDDSKIALRSSDLWIVTCEFDMDSELPAPDWVGDDDDYCYDEYDRLNDMGEWVGNFYEWLGDYDDTVIIDLLEQWLSYMTVEGASIEVNIHNVNSEPLLDWYVSWWGGRYVKKAG